MSEGRDNLTIVIKVGTSSLIREDLNSLHLVNLGKICETVRRLKDAGHSVCLVTSGAVGVGCQVMQLKTKPQALAQRQALAAVGQGHLMRFYSDFFNALSLVSAQVLLTSENLASESQYKNAQNTFAELFALSVVPVVNENDTLAVEELRFGDNDTLSAQVASLVSADWLVLLTDVDYLYTANPSTHPDATPIKEVLDVGSLCVDTSTAGTQWGTGGMATKLTAARIATAAGCTMAICNSERPEAIERIIAGEPLGTVFRPVAAKMTDRKRWILSVVTRGAVHVDAGCAAALLKKKNLYLVGITRVQGSFGRLDAVTVVTPAGVDLAQGLVNYSSEELERMLSRATGRSSDLPVDAPSGPEAIMDRGRISLLSKADV